jgi:two-component system CheB/CheR fusion protein
LNAVAKTHDLLVNNEWNGADLAAIARGQLAPYLNETPPRVQVEGPAVHLAPHIATPFGLLLHELATNASKYGGLSTRQGSVTVRWHITENDLGRRLSLTWLEKNGPRVEQPKHSGFGTYLIERGVPGSSVKQEFKPTGLVCTVELPLAESDAAQP